MAVGDVEKGEAIRQTLLSDPELQSSNPNVIIKVMWLDPEDYESVQQFTASFKNEFQSLDLLVTNEEFSTISKGNALSGHENSTQVNFLSIVLLTFSLLPLLEATAEKSGRPTRVTWAGSRMYRHASLLKSPFPSGNNEEILKYFDGLGARSLLERYADSKLFCLLFQLELAKHYQPHRVVINSFCPGFANADMQNVFPSYIRMPTNAMNFVGARSPQQAAYIALNAALIARPETHGRLLCDMTVADLPAFVTSEEGQRIQGMLWRDTIAEMERITTLPIWMVK